MMSVMPIAPQNVPAPPSASAASESGGDFAETLRAESAARDRATDRNSDREPKPGKVANKATDNPPNKANDGASNESVAGTTGESATTTGTPLRKGGRPGVAAGDNAASKSVQVEPVPQWLVLPQVVTLPAAVTVAGEGTASASVPGGLSDQGAAAILGGFAQAGAGGAGGASLAQVLEQGAAAGQTLPGALLSAANPAPESGAVESLPTAGAAEQAALLAATGPQKDMSGVANPADKGKGVGADAVIMTKAIPLPPTPEVLARAAARPEPVLPIPVVAAPVASSGEATARAVGGDPALLAQAAAATVSPAPLRVERPALTPGQIAATGGPQIGDPGRQAVVAPVTPASEGDGRQFSATAHTSTGKIDETVQPGPSGQSEFSTLMTRADSQGGAAVSRSAETQATAVAAPTATSVPESRIVDQVVSRVSMSSAGGETNLSMLLHPKELGEVRVDLVSGKDGMRAHLHTQSQMVQEVLERNLPRLREAFESQGLKVSDLQVSYNGRRDGGNTDFQQREQGQLSPAPYRAAESRAGAVEPEWPGALGATGSGWSAGSSGFSLRV